MDQPRPDRLIVVAPHLVAGEGREQFLSPLPVAMRRMAESSPVFRLAPMGRQTTPEAAFLGIPPDVVKLAPGPLTVAALRQDPPSDSVQFHVSLMSLDEGAAARSLSTISPQDLASILAEAKRLDTSRLTFLAGEGADHALVWESGSLDIGVVTAADLEGRFLHECLPEGDGELLLRRFIDDSVNLLDNLEVNRRREGEGLPKLNLLWPWGQGFRTAVPNLALRRGEVATVHSPSMRLDGLTRLAGYRHENRRGYLQGMFASEAAMTSVRPDGATHVVVIPGFGEVQRHGRVDEGAWALDTVSRTLLEGWAGGIEHPTEVLLLAPGGVVDEATAPEAASAEGLGFHYRSWAADEAVYPFDPRVFDDARVPVRHVWEAVRSIMEG